jgi:hypothetical protein
MPVRRNLGQSWVSVAPCDIRILTIAFPELCDLPLMGARREYVSQRRNEEMRRLIRILFAVSLLTSFAMVAQDTMKQDNMKAGASMKAANVAGKISDDGKTFVSDKDGKSWTISNPEAVKGHEGHQRHTESACLGRYERSKRRLAQDGGRHHEERKLTELVLSRFPPKASTVAGLFYLSRVFRADF